MSKRQNTKPEGPPRDAKGRVLPGHSLNPGGRPKVETEVMDLLKAGSPAAARRLVELIASDDPKAALAASTAVLDRVIGKPKEQTDEQGHAPVFAALLQLAAKAAEK